MNIFSNPLLTAFLFATTLFSLNSTTASANEDKLWAKAENSYNGVYVWVYKGDAQLLDKDKKFAVAFRSCTETVHFFAEVEKNGTQVDWARTEKTILTSEPSVMKGRPDCRTAFQDYLKERNIETATEKSLREALAAIQSRGDQMISDSEIEAYKTKIKKAREELTSKLGETDVAKLNDLEVLTKLGLVR
jgi:hypothetical protein